jgi:PAS domain S-box-containing protein
MAESDQRRAAEARDPYRELFERSADAILIIEGETFVDCNQATVEMLRYSTKEELLRTHPSELSPPTQPDGRDSYEKANEMIAVAFDRGSHRFEWDHMRADGEVFPVEVLLTAVEREGKRILHVVWRDITERKRLEAQLLHAQKMDAIGKLAGGIAHDFNNLLIAIDGNAGLLGLGIRDQPELLEHVAEIRKACSRAATLVRQLLTFSRKREFRPRVIDLWSALTDLDKMLSRLIGEDIELVTVPPAEPLHVKADPGWIEQIILNLVTNARDAMPAGGTLTVSLEQREVTGDGVDTMDPLELGTYAVIRVADTGSGMDLDTARRAFDPFFTTKGLGEGTGLGLSTVYGIAKQSGGTVGLESEVGVGTTVRVYLPVTEEDVFEDIGAAPLLDMRGSECVLVVEDERAVSSLVVGVLRGKGYRVLLAHDGAEAVELFRQHRDEVELILTDVVMPKLSGADLVLRVRRQGSQVPVLFMSGYTDDALSKLDEVDEVVDLLEKPFTANQLAQRVRRVLDTAEALRETAPSLRRMR